MKKGFTLQELLITVGIIGVVAAVTAPSFTNLAPDKTKTMYLRAFNALSTATQDMLNDDSLYWNNDGTNGTSGCIGLACINNEEISFKDLWDNNPEIQKYITSVDKDVKDSDSYNKWKGIASFKYPIILMSKLNLQKYENKSGNVMSFTTTDGIKWEITVPTTSYIITHKGAAAAETGCSFKGNKTADIFVKVDVNEKESQKFSVKNNNAENNFACNKKSPTVFYFNVENDGNITPGDSLGEVYLKTPTDLHRKAADFEEAEELAK